MIKQVLRLLFVASIFAGNTISAADTKEGWEPLFNGKDLSGWYTFSAGKKNEDPKKLFQVHGGMIHMYKDAEQGSKQPFGYIATEKDYTDYHLRFQYKWGTKKFAPRVNAKRDAGLMYHMNGEDKVWPMSMECQVQEGDVGDVFAVRVRYTASVDPKTTNAIFNVTTNASTGLVQSNSIIKPIFLEKADGGVPFVQGGTSGVKRVVRSVDYEVGGWNTVEVIVRGDAAVHIVNGKVNNRLEKMEQMVNGEWKPLNNGKIVFQQEGSEIFYRNIEIKKLQPSQKD